MDIMSHLIRIVELAMINFILLGVATDIVTTLFILKCFCKVIIAVNIIPEGVFRV